MPQVDPPTVSKYIIEVANDKIVPRFQNLVDDEIDTKTGPMDFVTIADIEAEEELTRIFKDIIPGSLVVGEEAVSKGDISKEVLGSESGYIWVIDPVDGTHNFAHGKPVFATMVALVKDNQTVQSWIYNIPGEEFAIAEKGSGVELDGNRIDYPQNTTEQALQDLKGYISRVFLPKDIRPKVEVLLDEHFGEVDSHKCCGHDYLDILRGNAHFAMYSRIYPWDHLPGSLMMTEAGGVLKKWDKSEHMAGDQVGGILVASNENMWDDIHEKLIAPFI